MDFLLDWELLRDRLLWPLVRLVASMSLGLLLANLLEAMHWVRFIARLTSPLVRLGHMGEAAGASFALAFLSPASSNAMLAEGLAQGRMSRRELIFANLFNSTPAYLVHLPTIFTLCFSFLGRYAFVYIGLTLGAAMLRTLGTALAGALMLPPPERSGESLSGQEDGRNWKAALLLTWKRFKKRIIKLLCFTVPIYCLVFILQELGAFKAAEDFMARHAGFLSFLKPQALGVIALSLSAELAASLSAAASLLHGGALSAPETILALLVGNILSSPVRAFRHQFPAYAGFFAPSLALYLVVFNQLLRALSLAVVTALYYWLAL